MNIISYIGAHREKLNDYVLQVLERRKYKDPVIEPLYKWFIDSGIGGKCIRGSLAKLGYEIASGADAGDKIMPISAAFEIVQTAVLCHDDIIDISPLRRGKPSVWKGIADESGDSHYGVSQAICLGDFGIILANNLISNSDYPAEDKIRALDMFHRVAINTMNGEMLDVQMTKAKDYSGEARIIEMAFLKTAYYTIIGPMQVGSVLGGASDELLDGISNFGRDLGIAFQLRDDILGVQSDEAETGKSDTSDIAEGKVTLLIHHALKNSDAQQREKLLSIYGKPDVSQQSRKIVNEIFENVGTYSWVEEKASGYLKKAKGLIEKLTDNEGHKTLLHQLSDFMVQRKN